MYNNCVANNAVYCTKTIHCERYSFSNLKQLKHENFISLYFLFSTSIQCNYCIIRMRSVNFTIWYNYVIIICWSARVATIARSHYIKNIVFMFVKMRFESLVIFFWKLNFSIDSNKLESFIVVYSLIENFINFTIDHSFDKNILL